MASVIFYSNYCPHSKKFIDILKRSGESSKVAKFICVDKNSKGQRPVEIKKYNILEVPTVISSARILPGIQAFEWLAEKIKTNNSSTENTSPIDHRVSLQGIEQSGLLNNSSSGAGLSEPLSIFGNKPFPPEGDMEKSDTFILHDDNLSPVKNSKEDFGDSNNNRDSLKAKQFDNAYNKLLTERQSKLD